MMKEVYKFAFLQDKFIPLYLYYTIESYLELLYHWHPPLKILNAHPLWHHRRWAKQNKNRIFYSLKCMLNVIVRHSLHCHWFATTLPPYIEPENGKLALFSAPYSRGGRIHLPKFKFSAKFPIMFTRTRPSNFTQADIFKKNIKTA